MGTIVALNGKGGTGKTTIAALLIKHLVRKSMGTVLAIDADPNSNLPEILGVDKADTIVGIVEDVSRRMDAIPAGMTKDRYIELRVQEALSEREGFDLLAMGRPEGPGCYCYVNNILRNVMSRVTAAYDYVIIDNAAGMEHISRRTMRSLDKFVFVSDHSAFGIRSAKRIYDLAVELGIQFKEAYLIVNKIEGAIESLEYEIGATKLIFAGAIPCMPELHRISVESKTIFECEDSLIDGTFGRIFDRVIGK